MHLFGMFALWGGGDGGQCSSSDSVLAGVLSITSSS